MTEELGVCFRCAARLESFGTPSAPEEDELCEKCFDELPDKKGIRSIEYLKGLETYAASTGDDRERAERFGRIIEGMTWFIDHFEETAEAGFCQETLNRFHLFREQAPSMPNALIYKRPDGV